MLGNRKPLLRSVPSGNDIHGRYRIGTPMKSTCASRPVPTLLRVSSVMLLRLDLPGSSLSGQVVKLTPSRLMTPCGRELQLLRRAARGALPQLELGLAEVAPRSRPSSCRRRR